MDDDDCDWVEWERTFRAAAEADDCAIFRDHLRRLELPDEPLLLLEGTIHFVVMWSAYFSLDHRESFAPQLQMQTYDPAQATEVRYAFTFDLQGKAYARVLVDAKFRHLDLADMLGVPWREYGVAGYSDFWISHLDWSPLTFEERCELEEEVNDDLLFDYSENELDISFEDSDYESFDETYLCVHVRERYDTEDDKVEEDQAEEDQP